MPITTGRYNPSKVRFRMLDDNWPDDADDTDGTVVIAPTSVTYSGTSAVVNGNGFVTFTSVGEFTLNGIFSATYDDYIITVTGRSTGVSSNLYYRLMSGVNMAATNYTRQYVYADGTSVTAARTTSNAQGDLGLLTSGVDTPTTTGQTIYFYRPFLSALTYSRNISADAYNGSVLLDNATCHNVAQSNTGLYVFPSAGLMTGTISVFGVKI